jgi:hypothetical protein
MTAVGRGCVKTISSPSILGWHGKNKCIKYFVWSIAPTFWFGIDMAFNRKIMASTRLNENALISRINLSQLLDY